MTAPARVEQVRRFVPHPLTATQVRHLRAIGDRVDRVDRAIDPGDTR